LPPSETREANGSAAVAMRGDIDVVVREAARESVQVTTDDNLLPLLETVVDNGTLRIQWKRGASVRTLGKTQVMVDVVKLGAVSLSGSGDLKVEPLKTPSLALSISGSSDAALDRVDAGELKICISGSSDVEFGGGAVLAKSLVAGSGTIRQRP
jgi:hypothetical protein